MVTIIRNIAIGVAIAILLPAITYVGSHTVINPIDPRVDVYGYLQGYHPDHLVSYHQERAAFYKVHFFVNATVGLLALALGTVVIATPYLSMGFILGGTFCLISGYFGYWHELNIFFKLASLVMVLLLLIGSSFNWKQKKILR